MKKRSAHTEEQGFIALTSALVMSAVLIILMFTVSESSFYARSDAMNGQNKRASLGLAESCTNAALLKISQDYNYSMVSDLNYGPISYNTADSGVKIPIDTGECYITNVVYGVEDPVTHRKSVDITTQAKYQNSFSNVTTSATVQNPVTSAIILPPHCNAFSINPTGTINSGQSVTLNWNSDGNSFTLERIDSTGTKTLGSGLAAVGTYADSPTESATYVGLVQGNAGMVTQCSPSVSISVKPALAECADTLMMLDRTASMQTGTAIADEKAAAEALLDLYGTLALPPKVGVGRFGNNSGVSAEIIPGGTMTNVYGLRATSTWAGPAFPSTLYNPTNWNSPTNAYATDGLITTSSTNAQQEGYGGFGFNSIPSTATITGIEITVTAKSTAAAANTPLKIPTSLHIPNNWTPANSVTYVQNNDAQSLQNALNQQQGFSNFGLVVPSGAKIDGIEVQAIGHSSDSSGCQLGASISWNNGTTYTNQKTGSITNADSTVTFGGPADLWTGGPNPSWVDTHFSNTNFVVRVNGVDPGINCTNNSTTYLNQLRVSVYYTPVSTLSVILSANNGASYTGTTKTTANLTTSMAPYVFPVDTWGNTWTPTNIKQLALRVQNNISAGVTASIDSASARVSYDVPSTGLYNVIENGLAKVNSYTNLGDAIKTGATELKNNGTAGNKKVLIMISDGTNVNLDQNNVKGGAATTQSAMKWALDSADNAKLGNAGLLPTSIFTVHFGNTAADGPYNPAPRDFLASMATGTFAVAGHQPGSQNNAGTSNAQSAVDAENTDGDGFYISPTSAAMANIFTDIGKAVCPALTAPTAPAPIPPAPPTPPPPSPINIGSWQEQPVQMSP